MPLKLYPPRAGKTPFYYVRGTHLGIYVDRSAKTGRKPLARQALRAIERDIESGTFATPEELTFAGAATAYMLAGGERRFLTPLIRHFGTTPLVAIGQAEIDRAASQLYPDAEAATRNRQVYSPISAIQKRAGIERKIKRPKGWRGNKRTVFLMPEKAFALLTAARKVDTRLWVLCTLLLYCGLRLSEALRIQRQDIHIKQRFVYIPTTKTAEPRPAYLPKPALDALALYPGGYKGQGRLFSFGKSGRLYQWFAEACEASDVTLPDRTAFHVFRHTYGTWMRLYGKLDDIGLLRTGAWTDLESVERYSHSLPAEEAKAAERLPVPGKHRA